MTQLQDYLSEKLIKHAVHIKDNYRWYDQDDFIQDIRLRMIEANSRWGEFTSSTLPYIIAKQEASKISQSNLKKLEQNAQEIQEPIINETPDQVVIKKEIKAIIRKAIETLNPKEKYVVKNVFGIDGEKRTYSQMAETLHCSKSNIGCILNRSLKKLYKQVWWLVKSI